MMNDSLKRVVFLSLLALFLTYSACLYIQQPVTLATSNSEVQKGKQIWQEYNCNACHQIYGQGGFLGPDLTNNYSKRGAEFINSFLTNGTTIMPNFHLSTDERNALITYLKEVDQSGSADPKTFKIYANGTIEQ